MAGKKYLPVPLKKNGLVIPGRKKDPSTDGITRQAQRPQSLTVHDLQPELSMKSSGGVGDLSLRVQTLPKKVFWGGFRGLNPFSGGTWTLRVSGCKTVLFQFGVLVAFRLLFWSSSSFLIGSFWLFSGFMVAFQKF